MFSPSSPQEGMQYPPASQTLVRGLDVLEMVAGGPLGLPQLANRLGLARSTTHRLATALLERRYLTLVPRQGYGLGPKLLELGSTAQEQIALVRVARPYLDRLASESLDTALLAVAGDRRALLLERVPGRRRLLPALRLGETLSLTGTSIGCALLFDATEPEWHAAFALGRAGDQAGGEPATFIARMLSYLRAGYAFDPADAADGLRAVAAPVRGHDGAIAASLAVAGAAQFCPESRLAGLGRLVAEQAGALSRDLGFAGPPPGAVRNDRGTPDSTEAAPEQSPAGTPAGGDEMHMNPAAPVTSHLEAGALSVHDPSLQGSSRAANSDHRVSNEREPHRKRRLAPPRKGEKGLSKERPA